MLRYFRPFGNNTVTSIRFPLYDAAAPENLLSGHTFQVGDIKFSKNEGVFANVDSLPTEIGSTGVYSWDASFGEGDSARILVVGKDQTNPKAFMDFALDIETFGDSNAQYGPAFDASGSAHLAVNMQQIATSDIALTFGAAVSRFQQWQINDGVLTPTLTSFRADFLAGFGGAATTDDIYRSRSILFTSGALNQGTFFIQKYDATNKEFVVSPMPVVPQHNDTFVIQ